MPKNASLFTMEQKETDAIAKDEEERWQNTYTAVEREIDKTEQHFKADRLHARAMTSELVATKRIEDKMQLLNEERVSHGLSALRKSKAVALDSLLDQPYFARMVCNENGHSFEFRLGTASFPEQRIVDWRDSPLSSLYYHHQQGESYCEEINHQTREGVVELRRSYRGKGKVLEAIELPHAILTRHKTGWTASEKQSLAPVALGRGAVFAPNKNITPAAPIFSRAEGQSGTLPPILSLLTPEQYGLITSANSEKTPMVIQGGAGSGKTTVALHRLAWLLHEKNSDARPENCLVVMANASLRAYVKYVLPELGVSGVRVETVAEWADQLLTPLVGPRRIIPLSEDAEVLAFKALPEMVPLLASFVAQQIARMTKAVGKEVARLDRASGQCWQQEVIAKLGNAPILQVLQNAFNQAKASKAPPLFVKLLEQTLHRMSRFCGDLHLLWQDDALLAPIYERYYASDPARWKKIKAQLALEQQSKQWDIHDDALLLHLVALKWGHYPKAAMTERLDHLVIDEAQDLSMPELLALAQAARVPHEITLVGDPAQKIIASKRSTSWDLFRQLGSATVSPIELTVAYRSTLPIMELATHVRAKESDTQVQYATSKMGPVPHYQACETGRDLVLAVARWIEDRARDNPHVLCGIICRFGDQARELVRDLHTLGHGHVRLGDRDRFDFSPGVIVTDVHQVKGLEFRNVLLVNPSARAYAPAHPESRNLLYVAITRAEARLDLLGVDPPTPLLPEWVFGNPES